MHKFIISKQSDITILTGVVNSKIFNNISNVIMYAVTHP